MALISTSAKAEGGWMRLEKLDFGLSTLNGVVTFQTFSQLLNHCYCSKSLN